MSWKTTALKNLGVIGFASFGLRKKFPPKADYALRSRHALRPVWVRNETTDLDVFAQIFCEREYRCLDFVENAELVIDCGANVGYSAAYFLTRFPRCRLVGIEPDVQNFKALQRNLEPYGDRAILHNTGVWSKTTGLVMSPEFNGQGQEWARQVREAKPDEVPQMRALDLESLIGSQRVSVLKIDIEGAEADIFSHPIPWISQVDNLVIELHGAKCAQIFHEAIQGKGFHVLGCGELTVCTRPVDTRH
jgi:FkbM family methyltransferase